MKIAIVVHGRFHGFDLARALLARGHEVRVLTNYPVWAARRFGIPDQIVRSFWQHGVLCRGIEGSLGQGVMRKAEPFLHKMFGRWAADQVSRERWDVIHTFSGIAEEILTTRTTKARHFMVRGSAHIRVQDRLLCEEGVRCGEPIGHPSQWMIAREEREYAKCDRIVVLSTFAYNSFVEQGVDPGKLILLPLGVETRRFRPSKEIMEERCRRILSGAPLNVLFTSNLTFRKGLYDFIKITQALTNEPFRFRVVGTITAELKQRVSELPASVELIPRQPQAELPRWYAEGDLFIFPTVEDGFAAVLAQASSGALPLIVTTNCAGSDLVQEGKTGWVLPIRSPEDFLARLRWCDSNRESLAEMVRRIYTDFVPRDWNDVAAEFETAYAQSRDKPV